MKFQGSGRGSGAALAAVLLLAGTARAAVYRCEQNGKITYTDQPCAAHAAPTALPELQRMDAGPRADLAKQYDAEAARDAASRRKARAEASQKYAENKAQADAIRRGMVEGRVVKGMNRDQVEKILNEPERVDGRDGARERWIYNEEGRRHRTITFENGVVVSDRTSAGRRR